MDRRFEKKIALVTGGNSGIGLATAVRLASEGATVVITGRDREKLNRAAKEVGENTLGIVADVSKLKDIEDAYREIKERYGRIDVLFANAGIAIMEPVEKVTEENCDLLMDINIKGTFFTIQRAIPLFPWGASVVVNASVADTRGNPMTCVYGATKAAVRSMARTFSGSLIDRGVRVNAISPGPIDTPIWVDSKPELLAYLKQVNPSKRFGTSEEIAAAVAFLLSSESAYIVGSELYVDGGLTQL